MIKMSVLLGDGAKGYGFESQSIIEIPVHLFLSGVFWYYITVTFNLFWAQMGGLAVFFDTPKI